MLLALLLIGMDAQRRGMTMPRPLLHVTGKGAGLLFVFVILMTLLSGCASTGRIECSLLPPTPESVIEALSDTQERRQWLVDITRVYADCEA